MSESLFGTGPFFAPHEDVQFLRVADPQQLLEEEPSQKSGSSCDEDVFVPVELDEFRLLTVYLHLEHPETDKKSRFVVRSEISFRNWINC